MIAVVASHAVLACGLVLAQALPVSPLVSQPAAVAPAQTGGGTGGAGGTHGTPATSDKQATTTARKAAQAALAEGNNRLKVGDPDGAIASYKRAQAIYPAAAAKVEFNIAQAEEARNDQPAAAAALERFLSQAPDVSAAFRDNARDALARLTPTLGALLIPEKAPGFSIFVDGQARGTTPTTGSVWVRPGRHLVTITDGARVAFTDTVQINAGASMHIDVPARPPITATSTTPPPPPLRLTLEQPKTETPTALHLQDTPVGRPVWKRWWFWTAGAVVVVSTVAIIYWANTRCSAANTDCMPAVLHTNAF
jgi:hypothetical protein